jgi:CDGSH-type Zn-finger protein
MIEGIDYCFIYPKDEKEAANIRLLTGMYKDTIFRFGKVKFKEYDDGPHLQFAFDVIESTYMKPKKMEKDANFQNYLGDMLIELMTANMDEEFIDENRNGNSKAPDLLGGLPS